MITTATEWKKGMKKYNSVLDHCQKLYTLADLAKDAESEYNNLIKYSLSEICNDGSYLGKQLKEGALRDAYIRKHQVIRLQRLFTNLSNELSI